MTILTENPLKHHLKILLFKAISILLGPLFSIIFFEMLFRILPVHEGYMRESLNDSDPVLRSKRNRDFRWSKGWNFEIITNKVSNNEGFLCDYDYIENDTSSLIGIIGDSFVEAAQIENKKTMHGIVSEQLKDICRVYNFSLAGSQLPSYLMQAKYAVDKFDARMLVFVIVGNDFDESVLKYRQTPGFYYFDNPDSSELRRLDYAPSLYKRLARLSATVRYLKFNAEFHGLSGFGKRDPIQIFVGNTPVDTSRQRVIDSEKAIFQFLKKIPEYTNLSPAQILLFVDGMRPHLYDDMQLAVARTSYFALMRRYLIRTADTMGYEIVDLQPIFRESYKENGEKFEFSIDYHWNSVAHKIVARQILLSKTFNSFKKTIQIDDDHDFCPSWSPDGRNIACATIERSIKSVAYF